MQRAWVRCTLRIHVGPHERVPQNISPTDFMLSILTSKNLILHHPLQRQNLLGVNCPPKGVRNPFWTRTPYVAWSGHYRLIRQTSHGMCLRSENILVTRSMPFPLAGLRSRPDVWSSPSFMAMLGPRTPLRRLVFGKAVAPAVVVCRRSTLDTILRPSLYLVATAVGSADRCLASLAHCGGDAGGSIHPPAGTGRTKASEVIQPLERGVA